MGGWVDGWLGGWMGGWIELACAMHLSTVTTYMPYTHRPLHLPAPHPSVPSYATPWPFLPPKANALFEKDKEYVVKGDEVMIVDEFSGRILDGRR